MKIRLLVLFILSIPYPVSAVVGPIVITPTRTAEPENKSSATVFVIDQNMIKKSQAKTTSDLLRMIPSVQVVDLFGNGAQSNIGLRGFAETANANTLILVNGHRLNHSDTNGPDLHHIFIKDIERVEVIVGSAGTLYGDQAVGGVINIITKSPQISEQRISLSTGSYDTNAVDFSKSNRINDGLAYRISAERFNSDNYRDNNEQEDSNLFGQLEYTGDHQKLLIALQQVDNQMELPGALLESEYEQDPKQSNAGFIDDYIDEKTTVARLGYEYNLNSHKITIDSALRETEADLRQSFRDNPSPSDGTSRRKNTSLNPKISGNWGRSRLIPYIIGLDIEETDYDLDLPNAFGISTASNIQRTQSFYFQVKPSLSDRLQFIYGFRHTKVENDMTDGFSFPQGIQTDDDITVHELGVVWRVSDSLLYRVRYDENFRFAKVNEIALAETGSILDNQTGYSFELGLDYLNSSHQVNATLYQLILEDEIVFDPTVGPDFGFGPTGLNVNLDETQRRGLALSYRNFLSDQFSFLANLTWQQAEFTSGTFKGNDISGISETLYRISADYHPTPESSYILEIQYTGDKYAQGDNANAFGRVDAVTVTHFIYNRQYKSWDFRFNINNLTDEEYAEFVTNNGFGAAYQPSPGRNFWFKAQYNF